ncbi:hypothetical protein MnTg02_03291 [bacterium MnTg02]|nr:hypothetical protein MnTg02_03291 [bacterium MnTg02]
MNTCFCLVVAGVFANNLINMTANQIGNHDLVSKNVCLSPVGEFRAILTGRIWLLENDYKSPLARQDGK